MLLEKSFFSQSNNLFQKTEQKTSSSLNVRLRTAL